MNNVITIKELRELAQTGLHNLSVIEEATEEATRLQAAELCLEALNQLFEVKKIK